MLTKIPELELQKAESDAMADAIAEVAQHYEVPLLSEKQMAWTNLATKAAEIYGLRAMIIMQEVKTKKKKKPANITVIDAKSDAATAVNV